MIYDTGCGANLSSRKEEHWHGNGWGRMNNGGAGRESGEEMDRRQADLPLDPRRLRNDDLNHRRGYGRDRRRPPRSRSRIYLISPRGTTVPRQRVRSTVALPLFLSTFICLLFSLARPFTHSYDPYVRKPPFFFSSTLSKCTPVSSRPLPPWVFTCTRICEAIRASVRRLYRC